MVHGPKAFRDFITDRAQTLFDQTEPKGHVPIKFWIDPVRHHFESLANRMLEDDDNSMKTKGNP